MGKKKFIDKKKAATFQLLARDSSDPSYESGSSHDRVFVRVDNSPYAIPTFNDADYEPEDAALNTEAAIGYDYLNSFGYGGSGSTSKMEPLPDHTRKEILELGFPDDGYNYLIHLREIRNTGGGSAYYENPKAKLDELPHDIKAYDASRLDVSKLSEESNEKMYTVASKTVNVKIQKAVDPEVAALLDDSDLSPAGSDADDFEEDFVIIANHLEGSIDEALDMKLSLVEKSAVDKIESKDLGVSGSDENAAGFAVPHEEKARVRRLLDEQFDVLELKEYGTDTEDEYGNYVDEEDEYQVPLAEKLNHAFKDHPMDAFKLDETYKHPLKLLHVNKGDGDEEESLESTADVIRRCREYAEKYEHEDEDEKVIVYQESSDESEEWDCETIISTYSNFDNHPGKIGAPQTRRQKKLSETVVSALSTPNHLIALKGKEKLPVDFLPRGRKPVAEKEKELKPEQQKRKQHGQESKEEKKERKAAVKEERREARRIKKEMKELYRSEAQRAQRVAAFTGPSSIHLM